jgi:hypothetical protein
LHPRDEIINIPEDHKRSQKVITIGLEFACNSILSVSTHIYDKQVNVNWKSLFIKAVQYWISSYYHDKKTSAEKRVKTAKKQRRQTVISEIKTRGDKFFFSTFSTDIRRPV